ncbi:MAG: tetratricopeptide repeat protein [Nitrospina sp.]|nr:tetratricopeptide repeat protein [Nitrospina sp.]
MISTPPEIKKFIGCVLLLILASIAVYFNSLKGSFQFDDLPLIESPWVANLQAFDHHIRFSSFENRPVVLWTYALNNSLARGQVFGFHLLNLAIHIGVTLLIFFIIYQTQSLQLKSRTLAFKERAFPLATALLFAIHPLNTDSVTYISSRSSLLATFFYLLSLYLFTHLFSRKNNILGFNFRWGLLVLLLISSYMSVASKLIGATLPVLMGIWYLGFIVSPQKPDFIKKISQPKYIVSIILFVGIVLAGAYIVADSWLYIAKDQGLELYGRMPYFLVQTKIIIFYYLKLFLFPFNLNIDSGLPFSSLSSDPFIWMAILCIVGIFYGVLRTGNLWLAVGFIWFLITLAPTSSIIPLNDLAVEHRTYLPMTLGLCMIAGCVVLSRYRLCLILLLPLFALTTTSRNSDWISEISLWKDSAAKNPHSTRPYNNLGKAYYEKGNLAIASQHLQKSVANIPGFIRAQYNLKNAQSFLQRREIMTGQKFDKNNPSKSTQVLAELVEPHYNLASVYLDQGRLQDAEKEYLKTLALRPGHLSSQIGLSSVYKQKGWVNQAVSTLERAVQDNLSNTDPRFSLARLNLGELYGKTGKIDKAIIQWQAALKINPSLLPAHFNLGTAYMMTDQLELSVNAFEQCLELNSRYEPALFNLGIVLQKQGRWNASTQEFENFITLMGANPSALAHIGFNFNQQTDWNKAQEFLEKSIALQPNLINARLSLSETFAKLGKIKKAREQLQIALQMNPAKSEIINSMMRQLDDL